MSEPTPLSLTTTLCSALPCCTLRERLPQYRTLEAASAATLGQALQEHPEVELVLLDLSMPGTRGFSALLHVRGEYPELPVVIISSNDHPRVIRRAQQFGAAGFIPKSAPAEAMGEAIAAVLDGGSWFPPMASERSEADAESQHAWRSSRPSSSACCCAWPMACSTNRSPQNWAWPKTP
jgi:DNA-binding NarL/FixJ family response regulator